MSWLFKKSKWSRPRHPSFKGGFTLLEMLVVIVIVIIMTTLILSNLPALRSKMEMDLIAQEVAITIRQAQVYGAVSRSSGLYPAHGIYIDLANPNGFIFFADHSEDGDYTSGKYDDRGGCDEDVSECLEHFSFRGGVKIAGLVPAVPDDKVHIIFQRPTYEARFTKQDGRNLEPMPSRLKIVIEKDGESRYINVWNSGHIYATRNEN